MPPPGRGLCVHVRTQGHPSRIRMPPCQQCCPSARLPLLLPGLHPFASTHLRHQLQELIGPLKGRHLVQLHQLLGGAPPHNLRHLTNGRGRAGGGGGWGEGLAAGGGAGELQLLAARRDVASSGRPLFICQSCIPIKRCHCCRGSAHRQRRVGQLLRFDGVAQRGRRRAVGGRVCKHHTRRVQQGDLAGVGQGGAGGGQREAGPRAGGVHWWVQEILLLDMTARISRGRQQLGQPYGQCSTGPQLPPPACPGAPPAPPWSRPACCPPAGQGGARVQCSGTRAG